MSKLDLSSGLKRKTSPVLIWLGLVIGWMALMYYLSNQPGLNALPFFRQLGLIPKITDPQLAKEVEFILRKSAHILEYMVLYILVFVSIYNWQKKEAKGLPAFLLASLLLCLLFAVSDEIHQEFIADRDGKIFDVLIDLLGMCFGQVVVLSGFIFRSKINIY